MAFYGRCMSYELFGKYTLFSCYGITANGNMSPVVIVFENENGTTWKEFGEFVNGIHLLMNLTDMTIVTDQDKGQKFTIKDIMDKTGHFHFLHHCRGDIIKMCGLNSRSTIYSALWVYDCVVGCQTVETVERENFQYGYDARN